MMCRDNLQFSKLKDLHPMITFLKKWHQLIENEKLISFFIKHIHVPHIHVPLLITPEGKTIVSKRRRGLLFWFSWRIFCNNPWKMFWIPKHREALVSFEHLAQSLRVKLQAVSYAVCFYKTFNGCRCGIWKLYDATWEGKFFLQGLTSPETGACLEFTSGILFYYRVLTVTQLKK